jgi:UDP-N-acetyl-D-glucosamine dehydrogenase
VLRAGQLVVLESTTYPGTTRERVAPLLERPGCAPASTFTSRSRPSASIRAAPTTPCVNTPKVIGGLTEACGDRAQEVYRVVCDEIVRVATPEAAELTKLLENIFRAVNIALVNELALLTDRMGIDIWEVIDAAATKPYGFMRFEPGPGMGGHCLPVDPFYLSGARASSTWRPSSSSSPARSTSRCPTTASPSSSGRSTTAGARCAVRASRCSA